MLSTDAQVKTPEKPTPAALGKPAITATQQGRSGGAIARGKRALIAENLKELVVTGIFLETVGHGLA